MKTPTQFLNLIALTLVLSTITSPLSTALAQGTAFTYQGRLNNGAAVASGTYDFRFTLFDVASGGLPLDEVPVLTNATITVTEGLFTTTLDFGNEFSGDNRWIELAVRTNGGGSFTTLTPRQRALPTPYAMYAPSAGYASTAEASGLLGTVPAASIAPGTITAAMLAGGAVSGLGSPDGSPANALTVNTNGYIGIGNTNPTAALSLTGGPTQIVPRVLAEIQDGTGGFTNLNGLSSVAVKGNLLAVGVGPNSDDSVTLINIADPTNPVWTNSIRDGVGVFTNLNTVTALAFSGVSNLLAIAASVDDAVTLVDVHNPASLVKRAELRDGVGAFLELNGVRSLAFSSNLLAIAAYSDHAVTLVDVNNPANPVFRIAIKDGQFGFNDLSNATHVAFSGNLLAIAAFGDNAVSLVDVSNPTSPILRAVLKDGVSGYNDLDGAVAVAFSGNLLAIAANSASAVTLVDVSNPASPIRRSVLKDGVGGFDYLNFASSVTFSGNLMAIAAQSDNAVTLVDVSNPTSPLLRGIARNGIGGAHLLDEVSYGAFAGTNLVVGTYEFSANSAFSILAPDLQTMSLSSAGWVGIGLSSPQAALHVQGDVLLEGGSFTVKASRVQIGFNTTASGSYSTAMGYSTVASGNHSTAMGWRSAARGNSSTVMGSSTEATGNSSTAMGSLTTASGYVSTAMGYETIASGDYSIAMGYRTTASGIYSVAIGDDTTASGLRSIAMGYEANATHASSFVWSDASDFLGMSSVTNSTFNVRAANGVHFHGGSDASLTGGGYLLLGPASGANLVLDNNEIIARNNGATASLYLNANGGSVYVGATIIGSSDRNLKENFAAVNAVSVLDKVVRLPISEWNYKTDPTMRHVGPMAQDFHAAFGLGPDDKHIATVDADGVALAAIQGLNQKFEEREASLRRENAELKARLEKLERLLTRKHNGAAK